MKGALMCNKGIVAIFVIAMLNHLNINSQQNYSLQQQLQFKYLSTNDGLPENSTQAICQDHKGFIWIGTSNSGISRYDGFNVINYSYKSQDSTSFLGAMVYTIFSDNNNQLWIGTNDGLNLYNREKDNFIRFKHKNAPNGIVQVKGIVQDINGTLWIGSNGLVEYNIKKDTIIWHNNKPGYPTEQINSLIVDNENNVWLAEDNNGVFKINSERSNIIHYNINDEIVKANGGIDVTWIYQDSKNKIWFGSFYNGVFLIKPGSQEFIQLIPDTKNLRSYRVRTIIEDDFGKLYFGTRGGLYSLKENSTEFYLYASTENIFSTLSHNSVNFGYKDNCGGIWFSTGAGGANYANMYKKQFEHYYFKINNPYFLNDKNVLAITEDKNGNLYIGTEQAGINFLNRKTGIFTYILPEENNPNSINQRNIKAFAWDKNNNLWIGEYRGGLTYLDTKTKKFKHFANDPNKPGSLRSNRKPYPFVDSRNNLWVTFKGSPYLDLLKDNSEEFIHFDQETALGTAEDKNGNLWFGTDNGLLFFNSKENSFIEYLNDSIIGESYCTTIDSRGQIWVGSRKGLAMFDTIKKTFISYNDKNGFPFKTVYGILEDNEKNLWISTMENGLVKFGNVVENKNSKTLTIFTVEDGIQGKQYSIGSFYKSYDGEMFFGGTNGFNAFYPEKIIDNPFKPQVAITKLSIYNQAVNIGDTINGKVVLKNSITETDELELTHKHNIFSLEFVALHYAQPEHNKYAYKLEPLENVWNYTYGHRNFATYTSLHAGKYIFKVKAANSDELWCEPIELKVTILPPWWNTLWFKISVILFILTTAIGFYLYRVNRLKRQKEYLQKIVKERTREIEEKNIILTEQTSELNETNRLLEERQQQIEEKNVILEEQANELNESNSLLEERQQQVEEQAEELKTQKEELEAANAHLSELNSTKDKFFSIIAHDLKNPFSTILGFAELLKTKFKKLTEEKKLKYSEVIYDSSKNIYGLLENLLQWARTQTDKITFEPSTFSIKHLVEQNIALLKEDLGNKNITVEYMKSDDYDVYADRNMINTVLRNLLSNAIKFTSPGGEILINYHEKNGNIEVSIKDNGIGMSADEIEKLFRVDASFSKSGTNGETGTGLGLILCKEFIDKNCGSIWAESNLGEGSKFSFTVPSSGQL